MQQASAREPETPTGCFPKQGLAGTALPIVSRSRGRLAGCTGLCLVLTPCRSARAAFLEKLMVLISSPSWGPGIGHSPWRLPQEALLLSFNCYLRVECPGEGTCLYPGLGVPRLAPLNAVLLILPGLDQPVRVSLQPPDPVSWRPGLPGSPAGLGTGGNTAIWQPKQSTSWPEPHTYVGPGWGWGRHSSRTKSCVTRRRRPPLTLRATACPLLQSGSSKVSRPHPCSKGAQEEEKIRWELWPTDRSFQSSTMI